MRELGKLHSLTYTLLREEGPKFFEEEGNKLFLNMITMNKNDGDVRNHEKSAKTFEKVYENACDIMEQRNLVLGGKMRKFQGKAHQLMTGIYEKTDVKYFPVISHGKFRVIN